MTIQTNSQNTFAAIGIREDLTDIVALIDPQETPFISAIGSAVVSTQTKHEWQVQPLAAASKTNFQLEGDDSVSASAAQARVRIFNYAAISAKIGSITGTMKAVDVAGISNELDNQKMLKAVELRRDMEVILLDNNAYVAGSAGTARECAGIAAYITNTDFTGADLWTVGSGTGGTAWNLTATTARAMSLTILNGAVKEAYIDGGKPDLLLLSPTQRINFANLTLNSSLGGAAQIRYNFNSPKAAALITAVDTWVSHMGTLAVMTDIQMASDTATTNGLDDTAYIVDTSKAGVSYLRGMQTFELAKTGDADKFEVLAEYTLQVDAPKAHAALFALS
jgi:hypothetical protein